MGEHTGFSRLSREIVVLERTANYNFMGNETVSINMRTTVHKLKNKVCSIHLHRLNQFMRCQALPLMSAVQHWSYCRALYSC